MINKHVYQANTKDTNVSENSYYLGGIPANSDALCTSNYCWYVAELFSFLCGKAMTNLPSDENTRAEVFCRDVLTNKSSDKHCSYLDSMRLLESSPVFFSPNSWQRIAHNQLMDTHCGKWLLGKSCHRFKYFNQFLTFFPQEKLFLWFLSAEGEGGGVMVDFGGEF